MFVVYLLILDHVKVDFLVGFTIPVQASVNYLYMVVVVEIKTNLELLMNALRVVVSCSDNCSVIQASYKRNI